RQITCQILVTRCPTCLLGRHQTVRVRAVGLVPAVAVVSVRAKVQGTDPDAEAVLVVECSESAAVCRRRRRFMLRTRSTRRQRAKLSIKALAFCGWSSDRMVSRVIWRWVRR